MKGTIKVVGRGGRGVACLAAVLAIAMSAGAQQIYTMESLNSTVSINADGGGGTTAGMTGWSVDGVSQAKQQWFYYRIAGLNGNQSIDQLGNLIVAPRGISQPSLSLSYSDSAVSPKYRVAIDYTLTGQASGSGRSILGETITFFNNSGSDLLLNFFDYSDYDLAGNTGGQSVAITAPTIGSRASFLQTLGGISIKSSSISGLNKPTLFEANTFGSVDATLSGLTDGSVSDLNTVLSAAGPADVTAAFQWNVTISNGSSLQISKTIELVPEPSSLAIAGLGLCAWALHRRKSGLNR